MNYRRIALIAAVLALCVVVLGAYVRLSDAGLGCPDWPGCYGHIGVPEVAKDVSNANEAFPHRPVEAHKAWKEMIHRYVAGTLGLFVLFLSIAGWRGSAGLKGQTGLLTITLGVVIFQALLGMWTVTLLVKPAIVTSHLLGGMLTLSLLWMLYLRLAPPNAGFSAVDVSSIRGKALLGLMVLVGQISLGGWTSTNYAALACTDFPTCQGAWLPQMDLREGFVIWRGLGVDYEFGVLDHSARVAIQFVHRVGALLTFLTIGWLAIRTISLGGAVKRIGVVMALLLLLQVGLGISNVLLSLPIAVAVAHNGVAALLLLSVVTLVVVAYRRGNLV